MHSEQERELNRAVDSYTKESALQPNAEVSLYSYGRQMEWKQIGIGNAFLTGRYVAIKSTETDFYIVGAIGTFPVKENQSFLVLDRIVVI